MTEFFAMGGYAGWVWSSYAIALVCVGALIWRTLAARSAAKTRLEALLKEDEA
ncbi:MAG: heme exporter protein CcmD [Pseudomonadota bacterium]